MIKTFAFLVKKQGISDVTFHEHWRHPHGTMTARIPQFVRYVQNHGIGPHCAVPHVPPMPYLGMPVIWTRDLQDLADSATHPDRPPLDADGHHFYDVAQLRFLVCEEGGVIGRPIGPTDVKAIITLDPGKVSADDIFAIAAREMPDLIAANVARAIPEANGALEQPLADMVLEVAFADQSDLAPAMENYVAALARTGVTPVGGFLCRQELVFDRVA